MIFFADSTYSYDLRNIWLLLQAARTTMWRSIRRQISLFSLRVPCSDKLVIKCNQITSISSFSIYPLIIRLLCQIKCLFIHLILNWLCIILQLWGFRYYVCLCLGCYWNVCVRGGFGHFEFKTSWIFGPGMGGLNTKGLNNRVWYTWDS